MRFERTAAYNMSFVISGQENLSALVNDAVIDMRKGIQVRLFQPEICLYPLLVQSDKVILVAPFGIK